MLPPTIDCFLLVFFYNPSSHPQSPFPQNIFFFYHFFSKKGSPFPAPHTPPFHLCFDHQVRKEIICIPFHKVRECFRKVWTFWLRSLVCNSKTNHKILRTICIFFKILREKRAVIINVLNTIIVFSLGIGIGLGSDNDRI